MTQVANLEVQIGLKDTLTKGLTGAQKSLQGFGMGVAGVGKGMQTVGDKMTSFGSSLSSNFAPLTGLITAGIEAAAGFEGIMTQLETFGGLTGDALEEARQKALDVGAATMFSAADAANAMLELTKAGFTVAESMKAVDGAMTLAAIGEMDVASAASIVSSTLAQFGLDAGDAGDTVDILAAAANASRASVQSIADALANVGPVASQAGLNLTETSAAIAVLSNVGIDGAEAGTKLKSMLLNFQGDTAAGAFDALGVSLYTAEGNTRNLDDVLDELAIALKDKSPEEQADLMKELAGSYGITALSALLAAGGIDGMITKMAEAPAAASLAEAAMGTFNGRIEGLKGSVETLMIEALTPLMDNVLGPLVTKVTDVINAMTTWASENPQTASAIGGVILVIGALGIGLTILGGLMSGVGMILGALGTGFAIVTAPIFLLGLAIGALIALVNDPGIQEGLKAWEGVFQSAGIIINAILNDIGVNVRTMIRDIRETVMDAQILFAEGQINMGFRVAENEAFLEGMGAQGAGMEIAKSLETSIQSYLSGETVNLDIGGLQWALSGAPDPETGAVAPEGMAQSILDNIVNPGAMQEAINQALATNDQAALSVLVPTAIEMGIDTQVLWDQYLAAATAAGELGTAEVKVGAAVTVNPLSIDLSPVMAGISAAGGGIPVSALPSIPHFADGGMMGDDGVAMLHAGERVLNPQETKAYNSGSGGGNVININGVQDVDGLLYELRRRGIDLSGMAA